MRYNTFRTLYKRNESEIVPALLKASSVCTSIGNELISEADKISDCGNFIHTVRCNHCHTQHFKSFDRCKSKFCYLCNRVKSSLWVAMLYSWLKDWVMQGNYVVFLNLTLKDTDKLSDGLEQLEGAWRLMTGKRYRKAFLSRFPGGFRAIEVKTGENSGQWHPHIHSLVIKEKPSYDAKFLHYVWPRCVAEMGGYSCNLRIDAFKREKGEDKESYLLRLIKSIKECCKYITKFNWLEEPPERIGELYSSLKGKRQYAVWGRLSYIRKMVNDKLAYNSEDEIKDFVCQVCGCTEGTPNKLFKEIWDSVDEPVMKDYSTLPAEHVAVSEVVKQSADTIDSWVQESLPVIECVKKDYL